MSTYDAIKAFYGRNWSTVKLFDLSALCSNAAMSVSTGRALDVSHFDGYMHRRKSIQPADRLDAASALIELAQVLKERLETMPQSELEEIDRIQAMLRGADSGSR